MRTHVEVFFSRIAGVETLYRRRVGDIAESLDPNRLVEDAIVSFGVTRQEMKRRVISHSTSWRFREPDIIILTYIAYSDWFDLGKECGRVNLQRYTSRNGHYKDQDVLLQE